MIDVIGICHRFVDIFHAFVAARKGDSSASELHHMTRLDELAAKALSAVFDMDAEGRIKKAKARHVVEKLGLIETDEGLGFELDGGSEDELYADEMMGMWEEDGLMHQAFKVFDEDGDGFIEAAEVKRVLECLGLAKGWDMREFEKMVQAVDLNFDGKVDFGEFELMMSEK